MDAVTNNIADHKPVNHWLELVSENLDHPNINSAALRAFVGKISNDPMLSGKHKIVSRYIAMVSDGKREETIDFDVLERLLKRDLTLIDECTSLLNGRANLSFYSQSGVSIPPNIRQTTTRFQSLRMYIASQPDKEKVFKNLDMITRELDRVDLINVYTPVIASELIISQGNKLTQESVTSIVKFLKSSLDQLPIQSFSTFIVIIKKYPDNSLEDLLLKLENVKNKLILSKKELPLEQTIARKDLKEVEELLFTIAPYFYRNINIDNFLDPIHNLTVLVREDYRLKVYLSKELKREDFRGLRNNFAIDFIKSYGNRDMEYVGINFKKLVDVFVSQSNLDKKILRSTFFSIIDSIINNNQEKLENFIDKLPKLLRLLEQFYQGENIKTDFDGRGELVYTSSHIFMGLVTSMKSKMISSIDELVGLLTCLNQKKEEFSQHPIFSSILFPLKTDKKYYPGFLGAVLQYSKELKLHLQQLNGLIGNSTLWNNDPNTFFDFLLYRHRHAHLGFGDCSVSLLYKEGPFSERRFQHYRNFKNFYKLWEVVGRGTVIIKSLFARKEP